MFRSYLFRSQMFIFTLMLFVLVDATPHQAQGSAFLTAYTPALTSEIWRREHTDALGVNRVSQAVAAPGQMRTRPVFTPRMQRESPNLRDVIMKPCKTLCKGCVPYICPLAPIQSEEDIFTVELSESQKRMLMLHKEKELELQRDRIEAIAAGLVQINSRAEFEEMCARDTTDCLCLLFWGGSWCRKCTALKPDFLKLSAELKSEHGVKILVAYCDAKAIAKASDAPPAVILQQLAGITTVPTFQCWRRGSVLEGFTAGPEKATIMAQVRRLVANHI